MRFRAGLLGSVCMTPIVVVDTANRREQAAKRAADKLLRRSEAHGVDVPAGTPTLDQQAPPAADR